MASIAVAASSSAAAAASAASSSSSAIANISGSRPSLFSSSSTRRIFLAGNPVKINSSVSQKGSQRFSRLVVRNTTTSTEEATTTTTTTETSLDTEEIIGDLKAKWDAIENKTNVFIYGGGALVAIWLSSTVVGAVNSVPLLPKVLELVGLGYTGWFVYRYLLFKESRKELARDIEELTSKITGTGPETPTE